MIFFLILGYVSIIATGLLVYGILFTTRQQFYYPILRNTITSLGLAVFFLIICFPSSNYIIVRTGFVTILIVLGIRTSWNAAELYFFERTILILFAWVGIRLRAFATSRLTIYLGLELQGLAFYILSGSSRSSSAATEAALTYFLSGAVASSFLLIGFVRSGVTDDISSLGLALKLGLSPAHYWVVTTYAGLHAGISGYLATVPKLSLSVLSEFSELDDILGHQSLFVASVGTFLQKETQAFLAYSSISHIAFISFGGGLDYAYAYTIIRANIWILLLAIRSILTRQVIALLSSISGFVYYNKVFTATFTVCLLSIAGIPPFLGFIAKARVITNIVIENDLLNLLCIIIASIVATYYYLRWIKVLYFDVPKINGRGVESLFLIKSISRGQVIALSILLLILLREFPISSNWL